MSFFSKLEQRAREADSLLCVGLDPHPADLPAPTASAAKDFCLRLIEATGSVAAAYKPNAAFFEALGPEGFAALGEVIAAVPRSIPVLLDAKRGDIASTAEAYARAAFDTLAAQAITINPYLGRDAVEPFIQDPERGVFLLCKTSNAGSADLQDLVVEGGERLYIQVARLARKWNTADNVGLVVGATHPKALAAVRRAAPELWILAPGVGAQGGDLGASLEAGLRITDGMGLLVPVSRGISRARDPRAAAEGLRQAINQARKEFRGPSAGTTPGAMNGRSAALADQLLSTECVRFGSFKLKSGLLSPIYLDLRRLAGHPGLLQKVAEAMAGLLRPLSFDRIAGLPYAGLPIATAVSLQGGWPMIYPRKEVKAYGTGRAIEGPYKEGDKAVLIDDLATTGGSKFEALEKLQAAGLTAEDVVVLVDRQSGATEDLQKVGCRLHAVFTLTELLDRWQHTGALSQERANEVRLFLDSTSK